MVGTGRFEHKIEIEAKIEEKIRESPIWLKEYYYSLANNTAATKRKYTSDIIMFFSYIAELKKIPFADIDLNDVTSANINQYITDRKKETFRGSPISNSTIATQISELKNFFDFVTLSGYISENPMKKAIKRPSVNTDKEVSYLTDEEISIIIKNLETGVGSKKAKSTQKKYRNRDRLLFLIPLCIGCRLSALDEINISDIDFENYKINIVDKGEKPFVQEVPEELIVLIKTWCEDRKTIPGSDQTDALFVSKKDNGCKRLSVSAIQRIILKYSQGIGRRITPHELRRTFGTQVYRMTGDIYLTSKLLGHSSPVVTKRYASVDRKEMKEVRGNIINKLLK